MSVIKTLVNPSYNIVIENNSFFKLNELSLDFIYNKNVVIITDSTVENLYLNDATHMIKKSAKSCFYYTILKGEQSKNLNTIENIYEFLLNHNIKRDDCLIALGGGVVGDITGFCASTYLRGINYIQIPTTLLSQVDSSIGGKTGVNLKNGKNLVGSFYNPKLVICDPVLLKTLDKATFNNGISEVIKYGFCFDELLFNKLTHNSISYILYDIIYSSIKIKTHIVDLDQRENFDRKKLNFGHTFAHAVERAFNYGKYSHGQAVAIGMKFITYLSYKANFTDYDTYNKLISLLKKFDLLFDCPLSSNDLYNLTLNDKKCYLDKIDLIIVKKLGCCEIVPFSLNDYKKFLNGNLI